MVAEIKKKYPDALSLCDAAMAMGIAAAIHKFLVVRKIDVTPTENCASPVAAFTLATIGEFSGSAAIYPFKKSLKEELSPVMKEIIEVAKVLYEDNDIDTCESLVRTVFYGEGLKFLDDNVAEAISIIKAIRETPIKVS